MEKRIKELDVLRVLAMLFVVTFHFGCESVSRGIPAFNFLRLTVNYDFGNVAVTIFLMLSGGLLYKKYGAISQKSLKEFFIKRVKSIYPPFWILNIYVLLSLVRHLISDGNPFYAGNPAKLLLTVFGFDGYAQTLGFETYFFCGEWFVGAIVFLYLLYPLLAKIYKRMPVVMMSALLVGYGLQFVLFKDHLGLVSVYPATLILKFCLGFFFFEHLDSFKKMPVALVGLIVFVLCSFVDIPGVVNYDCLGTVAALGLFIAVFYGAQYLLKATIADTLVQKVAKLSYCVFLVQHVIISWSQMGFLKILEKLQIGISSWGAFGMLWMTLLLILAVAWLLNTVSGWALRLFSGRIKA